MAKKPGYFAPAAALLAAGMAFLSCGNPAEPSVLYPQDVSYPYTDHRFVFMGREESLTAVSADEEEFANGLNRVFGEFAASAPASDRAVPFDGVTIVQVAVASPGGGPGIIIATYTRPSIKNAILLDGDVYELANGRYIAFDDCPEPFRELYREGLPRQDNYDAGSCFQFAYIDIPERGRGGVFYGYVSIVKDADNGLEQGWAMTGILRPGR